MEIGHLKKGQSIPKPSSGSEGIYHWEKLKVGDFLKFQTVDEFGRAYGAARYYSWSHKDIRFVGRSKELSIYRVK